MVHVSDRPASSFCSSGCGITASCTDSCAEAPSESEKGWQRYCGATPALAFWGAGFPVPPGLEAVSRPGQHPELPLYSSAEPSWVCDLDEASKESPGAAGRVGILPHHQKSLGLPLRPCCQRTRVGAEGRLAVMQDEASLYHRVLPCTARADPSGTCRDVRL